MCFFTKLAISLLLAKFARFNLKSKISAVNLLYSGVVIYLSWFWLVIFFSISLILCYSQFFFTKLLANTRYFIFNSSKSTSTSSRSRSSGSSSSDVFRTISYLYNSIGAQILSPKKWNMPLFTLSFCITGYVSCF